MAYCYDLGDGLWIDESDAESDSNFSEVSPTKKQRNTRLIWPKAGIDVAEEDPSLDVFRVLFIGPRSSCLHQAIQNAFPAPVTHLPAVKFWCLEDALNLDARVVRVQSYQLELLGVGKLSNLGSCKGDAYVFCYRRDTINALEQVLNQIVGRLRRTAALFLCDMSSPELPFDEFASEVRELSKRKTTKCYLLTENIHNNKAEFKFQIAEIARRYNAVNMSVHVDYTEQVQQLVNELLTACILRKENDVDGDRCVIS